MSFLLVIIIELSETFYNVASLAVDVRWWMMITDYVLNISLHGKLSSDLASGHKMIRNKINILQLTPNTH